MYMYMYMYMYIQLNWDCHFLMMALAFQPTPKLDHLHKWGEMNKGTTKYIYC